MLSQFHKLSKICSLRSPVATFAANGRFFSQAAQKPITPSIVEKPVTQPIANKVSSEEKITLDRQRRHTHTHTPRLRAGRIHALHQELLLLLLHPVLT